MNCWRKYCMEGFSGRSFRVRDGKAPRASFPKLRTLWPEPSRLDPAHLLELPPRDLEDDDRLLGVAVFVDGDVAAGAGEVLRRRQGVADLSAVGRAGALDGVGHQFHRVVAEDCHRVGDLRRAV